MSRYKITPEAFSTSGVIGREQLHCEPTQYNCIKTVHSYTACFAFATASSSIFVVTDLGRSMG